MSFLWIGCQGGRAGGRLHGLNLGSILLRKCQWNLNINRPYKGLKNRILNQAGLLLPHLKCQSIIWLSRSIVKPISLGERYCFPV